jgi:hypothetical protein
MLLFGAAPAPREQPRQARRPEMGATMKRPSRELNIFSVSALDLFASAMGAFILIAVILFPYYQQNAKIVQELKEAKAAATQAIAERDKAEAERAQADAAAKAAEARAQSAEQRVQAAEKRAQSAEAQARAAEARAAAAEAKVPPPPKPSAPQTAGSRSAWLYGNLEFVMYEYPGRQPGTQLVVGIVTRIRGSSTAHLGDVALLAVRNGSNLVGDLWGFASQPTCFLDTLPMKFQAQFAPSGQSLHVNRQTATLSGGGATCVLRSDGTKSFTMNQVN